MEIVFALCTGVLLALIIGSFVRRRSGGGLRLVHPGAADAADPADYGFVRQELLDIRVPGPDEDLMDALRAVQESGTWQAASYLLAGTPKEGELRWQRVQAFAGAAALDQAMRPEEGGAWLRRWVLEAGKDAGCAQVHAEFLVQKAWRSSEGVGSTEHRIMLEEALKATEKAALLSPGDPVPYIVQLTIARGLGWTGPEFDAVWAKVIDRAPTHMGAHLNALQYWCAKWHGSPEQADAFAHTAAARAPRGSLLAALPLFAVQAHLPEVVLVGDFWRTQVVTRAVEGAMFAVRQSRPEDPMAAHVRHLLLWFLVNGERWAEAMEQVRHVDGYVGALPWSHEPDPAGAYAVYRALAVAGYEANGGSPATLPH
ncbi:hypothetical protein ACN20G_08320 [Streptomyces sp. BI20]|uniref:hypothetical protein n=1 Tax=Streptomyces sp. BI20 TaxID=3403460 RepID=UPI003C743012